MIKVQDLGKSFDSRFVVRKLSFQAPDGAITGLLGSNGAGKTTTLRMIGGVLKPDSGSILIDGVGGDPLARQRRVGGSAGPYGNLLQAHGAGEPGLFRDFEECRRSL